MMISLGTLQTLLFTLGPLLLPRLISSYRSHRTASKTSPLPIIPTPRPVRLALNILFASSLLSLILTLPFFTPENILLSTSSRLQTPPDVLYTRLASIRTNRTLTPLDEALRPRIASLEARCLYLTYGPDTLANCPWCTSDDPRSYLYFALPNLIAPHLVHLLVLGLATSTAVASKCGNRWRNWASILGVTLAVAEIWSFAAYDHKANARVLRPEDLTHFYWRMRTLRGIVFAIVDLGFAGLLYLSSTNRFLGVPVSTAERLETVLKTMEQGRGKMAALGIIKNAVYRNEGLSERAKGYWRHEGVVMEGVMAEREVVEGVRSALEGRVRLGEVEEEAGRYAEGIVLSEPLRVSMEGA